MGEPVRKDQEPDDGVYEFVCADCGATRLLPLTSHGEIPQCRCGFPLWPVARAAEWPVGPDLCGEAFLDELCNEPTRVADRDVSTGLIDQEQVRNPKDTDDEPDYAPLDHPHVEPYCQFCATRQQRPSQHRLWCAVFLLRECTCGYERR